MKNSPPWKNTGLELFESESGNGHRFAANMWYKHRTDAAVRPADKPPRRAAVSPCEGTEGR